VEGKQQHEAKQDNIHTTLHMKKIYTTSAKKSYGKILLELDTDWRRSTHFNDVMGWFSGYYVGMKAGTRINELSRKGLLEQRIDPKDGQYVNYRLKQNLVAIKEGNKVVIYDKNHNKHFHYEK